MGNNNSAAASFEAAFSRLLEENVSTLDDEYWNAMFSASITDDNLKTYITCERVRSLRMEQKVNCCTLLKKILAVCRRTADEGQYINSPLKETSIVGAETAVRILTRLIPTLLEVPNDSFCRDLFWKPGSYVPAVQREFRKQLSQTSPDVATEKLETSEIQEMLLADDETVVLAEELLVVLQRLLFVRGYTLHSDVPILVKGQDLPKHRLESEYLWCGGIISPHEGIPAATNDHLYRRADILQCVVMCLSSPLFATLQEYPQEFPKWMSVFVSGDLPFTATLFCSIVATVFSHDPVGYALPFGSAFSNSRGVSQRLVEVCLQFLCLVMDVDPQSFQQASDAKKSLAPRVAEGNTRNVYRTMLSGLNKDAEIGMIYNGIIRLISTIINSALTTVRSIHPIEFDQELLTFIWLLLTCNSHFLRRITTQPYNSNLLLHPLLYILLEGSNRRKALHETPSAQVIQRDNTGMLHVVSFILLILSSEREFAIRLNDPYEDTFPLKLPLFQGCHADLMLLVIHRVCIDAVVVGSTDSLIDMLLTAFCNVSAYIKSFCMESAVKLLALVERFSRPNWFFAMPYRVQEVAFLLDSISNLIQYQYEGNTRLVYAILRQRQLFFAIQEMPLPSVAVDQAESDSSTAVPSPTDNLSPPKLTLTLTGRAEQSSDAWRATSEWLKAWKSKLQLQAITRLINSLYPKVETECREKGLIDQSSVLQFLHGTTLVGILPVPHPIVIRNYQANPYTTSWWTAFTWGVIFSRNHLSKGLVDTELVRLVLNQAEDGNLVPSKTASSPSNPLNDIKVAS